MHWKVKQVLISPVVQCLLLVVLILLFSHHQPGGANDGSRMALIESLLNRGEVWIENSVYFNRFDTVYVDGHFYSDKPPLLSLYSAALLFPFRFLISQVTRENSPLPYFFIVVTSSGFAFLGLWVLMIKAHRALGISADRGHWAAYGMLFGSAVLPYAFTYNPHILGAFFMFCVLVLLLKYREHAGSIPIFAGALTGLSWLVHPFAATFVAFSSGLYFLRKRWTDAARYGITLAVIVLMGLGMHQWLYGTAKPFYFEPGAYLYGKTSMTKESPWIRNPVIPGLTEEKIIERFRELNLPDSKLEESVKVFREHKARVRNPFLFLYHKMIGYDFLIINPLVFFCLLRIIQSVFTKGFSYRGELLWVLGVVVFLYGGTLLLRTEPGSSFGNLYLIACLPSIFLGASLGLSPREMPLFKKLFWVSFCLMLPGVLSPWEIPHPLFIKTGFVLTALLNLGLLLRFGLAWRRNLS